ncbi:MAG: fibronectin type III domain-containing protein [Desulfobacterales bacterium]
MQKIWFLIQDTLKSVCLSGSVPFSITSTKLRPGIRLRCLSLLWCAIALSLCFAAVPTALAKTVTVAWDANEEPDLEGYVLYRNTGSPGPPYNYSDEVPEDELADPLHPQAKLTGLQEGKQYYVALTAYNTEGLESNFSKDVCVEVVDSAVELCGQGSTLSVSTGSSSGGSGGGGGICFISTASTEASLFSVWITCPVSQRMLPAMMFLLLVLTVAFWLGLSKFKKEHL